MKDMYKVESDWLQSIGAPVRRLPKHVAEAVAARVLWSNMPPEYQAKLRVDVTAKRIVDQVGNDED